jgi:2-succinyl-5-enolpyruvyl-6-hydroxy-3-cyclohexene-1-carboxylate synthase
MLVCTSGTAAANYLPAVVEAHYGRVPLVVVTADRPPEMRESGARQTIDQRDLYERFIRWSTDLVVPAAADAVRRQVADAGRRAATLAAGNPAGPVHLNVPFREPLLPNDPTWRPQAAMPTRSEADGRADDDASRLESTKLADERIEAAARVLSGHARGLIIAGQLDRIVSGHADSVARLADATGYPIVAEPTSGIRFGSHDLSRVVSYHDALLRSPGWKATHVPEVVIRLGERVVWRHVAEALDVGRVANTIWLHPSDAIGVPERRGSVCIPGDPTRVCEALVERMTQPGKASQSAAAGAVDWTRDWRAADDAASAALESALTAADAPRSTAWVHRAVAELAPEQSLIWLANSMAVRDADSFAGSSSKQLTYTANWGAAGIDGTVSSALGAALGSARPTVLIAGDLTFAHDIGGLAAAGLTGLDVTIVVLNDGGGGIFEYLPVASLDASVFERFFTTPSVIDVEAACRAFDVTYTSVADAASLSSVISDRGGVRVAEVDVDRAANTSWHRRYWDAVDRAIGG